MDNSVYMIVEKSKLAKDDIQVSEVNISNQNNDTAITCNSIIKNNKGVISYH